MFAPRRLLFGSIAVVTLAVAANASFAQDFVNQRTLADHTFPSTPTFRDPFLNTNVGFSLGAGQAVDLEIPLLVEDGQPLYLVQGDITFLLLQLGYQQRVASWLSLGLDMDVVARMGTTTASLVAEGGTALYGPELSAKIRILEKSRFAVSGNLAASKRSLYDVDPLDFARDVLDQDGIDSTTTLLTSSDGWRYQAGFTGVYVFSPRLGLKGNLLFNPGDRLREEDVFDAPWSIAAALSWDANPFGWSLGLVPRVSYRTSSDLSSDVADNVAEAGLGIFYKGRQELVLGVDLGWLSIDQKEVDTTLKGTTAQFVMRYDF